MTDIRLMAVDPPGCGCTDCLVGYSVPLDLAGVYQLIKLHFGKLEDRLGGYEYATTLNVTFGDVRELPNGRRGGVVVAAHLVVRCNGENPVDASHDVTQRMQEGDLCCDCVGGCNCDELDGE